MNLNPAERSKAMAGGLFLLGLGLGLALGMVLLLAGSARAYPSGQAPGDSAHHAQPDGPAADKVLRARSQSLLGNPAAALKAAQEAIKQLERQQRRQRQEIFDVEDEIEARRDALIDALEKQMHQRSSSHQLFRVRWSLA